MKTTAEPGSFRDPKGHVFYHNGRILRTVTEAGKLDFELSCESNVLKQLIEKRKFISSNLLEKGDWPELISPEDHTCYVLEHEKIPFISYPYEWCFSQLKAAALLHLEIQTALIEDDLRLSDASAYNIQFIGNNPIFVDRLSVEKYVDGEYWAGYRQFCEQFLNPLLLSAWNGIPHNEWYRGTLEGITSSDLVKVAPLRKKLNIRALLHVTLQAKLNKMVVDDPSNADRRAGRAKPLSRNGYIGILKQLEKWISSLSNKADENSVWATYAECNTYASAEKSSKLDFVQKHISKWQPKLVADLGCNTGDFSRAALDAGAGYVVGYDFDHNALDRGFHTHHSGRANFLPLWLNAANPSPDQGWNQTERAGFSKRTKCDAVMALAFEHHLAIAKNVPLPGVINWILSIAPNGIVEFVTKNDPTVQIMLSNRQDIFPDYSLERFEQLLLQSARIVEKKQVSDSGRTLFAFERK